MDTGAESPGGRSRGVERAARAVAVVVGVMFVVLGLWAFAAPRSFFDAVAVFEPYNQHFLRDIGAFQIGLGAVLLFGAYLRDALLVALSGVAVGAIFHAASHVIDRDLGGDPQTDIPFVVIVALVLVAAAIARAATAPRDG